MGSELVFSCCCVPPCLSAGCDAQPGSDFENKQMGRRSEAWQAQQICTAGKACKGQAGCLYQPNPKSITKACRFASSGATGAKCNHQKKNKAPLFFQWCLQME